MEVAAGVVVVEVVVADPAQVVVVAAVVDFLAAFSVAVNHPPAVHRILVHHQTVGHHIRNKLITLVPEHIPTRTTDGILEEINTIRIRAMGITTIRLHLLQIGDRRTIVRRIIVHLKMPLDHFIQLAVVQIFYFYLFLQHSSLVSVVLFRDRLSETAFNKVL